MHVLISPETRFLSNIYTDTYIHKRPLKSIQTQSNAKVFWGSQSKMKQNNSGLHLKETRHGNGRFVAANCCFFTQFWSNPRQGHTTTFRKFAAGLISKIFVCLGVTQDQDMQLCSIFIAAAKIQKYLHVLVSPETRTYNYVHQISGSQISKIWFANLSLDFGHANIGWAQYLHVLVSPETRTCKYFLARIPGKGKTSSLLKMNTQYQNYKPKYAIISWNLFQKIFACPSLRWDQDMQILSPANICMY